MMPTCPNCGEIIMNGDPYCPNCGTTFRWSHERGDEDRPLVKVLSNLDYARISYDRGNYSSALSYLITASEYYRKLNGADLERVGENAMNQDWIVDVCCKVFNQHDEYATATVNFMKENRILVQICNGCEMIFPYDYAECPNCHEPFEILKQDTDKVKEQISEILDGMYLNPLEKLMLINKAISLIKSNDCRLEEIRQEYDSILFTFKKEHRYFYTEYECIFSSGYFREDRVFYDCTMRHNHDKLLQNDSFKKMIRDTENKTGFTFRNCGGGYDDSDFDIVTGDFTFNSRFKVFVRFDTDGGRVAVYDLDLDKMELSEEYRLY